jgi:uncharacterized protein
MAEYQIGRAMDDTSRDTPEAFHVLAKPTGPLCNLECTYCFYLEKEKLYPSTGSWSMTDDVLESFVRQYIEAQDVPAVTFAWQGGEPTLMGVGFFRKAVELQRRYANGKRIENSIQTNGVLLDDAWCEFLAAEHFLVGISIDGPRKMHDRYRVDKGGAPTFERVMKGLEFLQKHHVEFNTLTCVQKHNSGHPLEVYEFLKAIGSRFMQFIPVVERVAAASSTEDLTLVVPSSPAEARVAEWSVEPSQFGKFLCAVFDEWVRRDVGCYYVQLFDVMLESWLGMEPSLCVFRTTCGDAVALEHNGDLYSCDHYVYPENRLGNIMETQLRTLMSSRAQRRFGSDKHDTLPAHCRNCEARFACGGECPKHRFMRTPGGEEGLNYLCAGYKMFLEHIDPFMRFMAAELRNERAPANVMDWIRKKDAADAVKMRPGRNDLCPCGSGRKYKKCCGVDQSE